ncbi:MAG TPA: sigma-70 family RNA polymerase sigma factor [Gaiellaceae bacterium]|nr:sigma-70 family RNA polymerase sigma factor [Gaiellaceae bacterium]
MTPMLAQRPRADRAFERLYRQNVREVYRYALVVLRSPEDAEDVTQTTFLNAYRAFLRGERLDSPSNRLITIAHELCQQRARQEARLDEVDLEEQIDQAVPDEEGPTGNDIQRALGHLRFIERAALIMREVEDRSYAEIAQILNVSGAVVETLIFRARRALREELEGALTCHEAERAISRQLDGVLPRSERRALRAHVRECEDCAAFARGQRSQRGALRALANVALPPSLSSFFGETDAPPGSLSRA